MTTTYKKISELTTSANVSANDRIVLLSDPANTPLLQTVSFAIVTNSISQNFVNTSSPVITRSLTVNSNFVANATGSYVANAFSNNLTVNTGNFNSKVQVGAQSGYNFGITALIEMDGSQNTYIQSVIQNANTGTNASGDLIVTADNGNDTINFVDLGINSSNYNNSQFSITGSLDAYLYSSNSNLVLGTASNKEVVFHANGTTAADRKLSVNAVAVTVANSVTFYANTLSILGTVTTGNDVSIAGNLTVGGNVVLSGNTTFINATVITTKDKNLVLANAAVSAAAANGSGLVVKTYANLYFDSTTTSWQSNVDITPVVNNQNIGNTGYLWNVFSNNVSAVTITSGNSTVYSTTNSTARVIANTTGNVTITPWTVTISANNNGGFYVGNSVTNSVSNATGFYTSGKVGVANSTSSDSIRAEGTISALSAISISNSGTTAFTVNNSAILHQSNTFYLGTSNTNVAGVGYSYLPNGLVFQWGSTTANTTAKVVTFAAGGGTAFSLNCFSVTATSNTLANTVAVYAVNTTAFTIVSTSTTNPGVSVNWMAIGK